MTIELPLCFETLSSDDKDVGVKVEKVVGGQQLVTFELKQS